jgi:hypothetical protein
MLTTIRFENFRGFRNLSIDPLKRVNLLIGSNGSGKTCVLEGLYLLLLNSIAELSDFPSVLRIPPGGGGQGDIFVNFWKWVFYDQNAKAGLRLEAGLDDRTSISLRMALEAEYLVATRQTPGLTGTLFSVAANSPVNSMAQFSGLLKVCVLPARWTDPTQDAELFNLVAMQKDGEHKMEELMRVVEPRLQRLRYAHLPACSRASVYADMGLSSAMPFTQMGQAFSRVLHLYCQVQASQGQVLLVDEIENGIYHEALPQFWKGLLALCEAAKVQVFATTHSRECMLAADAAARERSSYDLNFVRLDRLDEGIKATVLDDQTMKTAREFNWEMR